MILKQNFRSHLKVMNFALSVTLMLAIAMWYLNYNIDYLKSAWIIHLLNCLPAFYLHVEYSLRNWNQSFSITKEGIIITNREKQTKYDKEDFRKITIVKSASLDKGGIPFTAIESYYHYRILMKSGEEIILTCVLGPAFDEVPLQFKDIPQERVKKLFCSIDPI